MRCQERTSFQSWGLETGRVDLQSFRYGFYSNVTLDQPGSHLIVILESSFDWAGKLSTKWVTGHEVETFYLEVSPLKSQIVFVFAYEIRSNFGMNPH